MNSIKSLEQTLQNLQKQKLERLQGHVSSNTSTHVVPFVPSQNPIINNNIDHEPLLVNHQQLLGSSSIFETWASPNVTISMCGTEAHISICSLIKKPGLFTTICFILKNHNHEIVSAQISSDDAKTMYMIHVRVSNYLFHYNTIWEVENLYVHWFLYIHYQNMYFVNEYILHNM